MNVDDRTAHGTNGERGRHAVAGARVTMAAATVAGVASNTLKKGDVLATARYAAVQAAKHTSSLVAQADPATALSISVQFELGDQWIDIEAAVDCADDVDIEAHALSGATVAALTIYDMCKSVDRAMTIGAVALRATTGGRYGPWHRDEGEVLGEN